ncbi:hypothetical protein [Xenophilus sp.]|uniref:hypothetical protein n=1 Tax=Xenophilus sp. TaxID=1873499 RepID=UPI0037DDBCE0
MIAAAIEPVRRILWDEYSGTAEELIAAGVARDDELPGRPGNGRYMMSFTANGQRVSRGAARHANKQAGYRQIRGAARGCFIVLRAVGEHEARARLKRKREAEAAEERERQERMRGWPFPVCMGVPC